MNIALKVLEEITKHGFKAYIVGGFVRDYLIGLDTNDVDICTDATPKDIKKIFINVNLPIDNYSAVRLYIKKYTFDIMTFRKEISYYNNRKPQEIEYITDLKEDLLRRDFTINSLCMDHNGNIVDLLNVKDDIDNRIIKCIGDPITRFIEDPLRILRAIRFYTVLDFDIDFSIIDAIKRTKGEIKRLSYSRKKDELDKIFNSPNASRGVKLIIDLGLDKELELDFSKCILNSDLIGIWSTIGIGGNYPFTKNEKFLIEEIKKAMEEDLTSNLVLYKYGLYVASIAGELKQIDRTLIANLYGKMPIHNRKDVNITSLQIMELLNISPSHIITDIYDDLINKILCGKLNNNYQELANYIVRTYK